MAKLTKKERKREEAKAFKLVKKLGNSLTGLDASRVGDNAYLIENVLKRMTDECDRRGNDVSIEDKLAYRCLQVASRILSRSFDDDACANGLLGIASAYSRLFTPSDPDNVHAKLVRHGLNHVVQHLEPVVKSGMWIRYEIGDGHGKEKA